MGDLDTMAVLAGSPADPPDDVLVGRVRAGDEAALSALYRRYVGPIYRFVLAQVRDAEDAEDLTSETFARMVRGVAGFRGDAAFRNWLYQIARNAVRNHRRASHYRLSLPLPLSAVAAADEVDDGASALAETTVVDLLAALPPRYRRVLELRFLEACSIEETASRMGITVGNAKVLQHRALQKAATVAEAVPLPGRDASPGRTGDAR
jgi:RNA polymerase sigma factor (sigma-70 family)